MAKLDFLLTNSISQKLYHEYAELQPIIDFHCHLEAKEIFDDQPFKNLTEAWLGGDHYKWRLMRANGVSENLITGDGPDYEKFLAFAQTMEQAIGNPVYIWTQLELKRYFGIDDVLNTTTAPKIWEQANCLLKEKRFSRRELIVASNVELLCTTDDPADDLHYHQLLQQESRFKTLPTFRPDRCFVYDSTEFNDYLNTLTLASGQSIRSYEELVAVLYSRIDYFHNAGCRLADHGLDAFDYCEASVSQAERIWAKKHLGERLTYQEQLLFCSQLLKDLTTKYHELGWTMQLHINALRNNNQQMLGLLGANTGFDGIASHDVITPLKAFLNQQTKTQQVPQMIVYSLNSLDLVPLAILLGCFQGEVAGKIQLGAAWWFNDTRRGMRQQLETLAETGLLGNFVGMLTDSRSFLSYPRHEYFRRILCQLIGEWYELGELSEMPEKIGQLVSNISYGNAKRFFNW